MSQALPSINVFILEDEAATRASLEAKVEQAEGLAVCGSVGTLREARHQLLDLSPDALLVDLQLPDGDGTALIAEQTALRPSLPILVISVFGDEARVVNALRAGAQGYLLKDDSSDDLAHAVRQLSAGLSPISPAIARHLIRNFQATDQSQAAPTRSGGVAPAATTDSGLSLSQREREVLQLAAKGLTYQETAEALGVTINTVGTYTRRIYTKLAVNSRTEALFEARQLGLMGED